jgi:adenylate cyclase
VLDYIFRGRAAGLRPSHNYAEMISLFEHALALDPQSVEAQSRLAIALTDRVLNQMADSGALDVERAERLTGQALAASPRYALAHHANAQLLRGQGRRQEAIPEYETALALNRNLAPAYGGLGWCKFFTGSIEEAIPLHEQAIRLSPRDPVISNWSWRIGVVHLLQSRIDEAIVWLEKARSANPARPFHHLFPASAYALKGESERAAELAEARRLSRDDRFSSLAHMKATGFWPGSSGYWGVPKIRALFETAFFAGLHKAGMPEE